MPYRFDLHVRLEAINTEYSPPAVRAALRAEVHDPLWLLGRQWQLGEHQGRDAASPTLVNLTVTETPIVGRSSAPEDDPRITPPEVIIESEPEQWWTIGRRARIGQALRANVPAARRRDAALLFAGLPAPYDSVNGRVLDGLALYRARASLSLADSLFTARGVPLAEPPDDWQPADLTYSASFTAGPTTLWIPRHGGGDVDWYAATASGPNPPLATPPVVRTSYPTRVAYPGAPQPRWWQIEDRRFDPGAVAPHRTHLASLLLIYVTASHGDDWFTAPLLCEAGTLVAVTDMEIEDSLGLIVRNQPADDWSMFHVSGRPARDLLIWPTVANPLTGTSPLDDLSLGIDEDANLLWAIERRVDGIEMAEPDEPTAPAVDELPTGQVDMTANKRYRYVPATGIPRLWHPYVLSDAGNRRRFIQAQLADLNVRPVVPRPGPTSRMLRDPTATPTDPVHQISPAALPRTGVRLDRRYMLGRRTDGQPSLWVQRRRYPLSAPPASTLRFDVVAEAAVIR
jgi:hypothetical protein